MPNLTTFGFEAEFTVNASAVISRLHAEGLAGMSTLHGYHCDCDDCLFDNGYAFRGQTDSSCSGEVITDVFGREDDEYDYDPPALMQALATAAVEGDAEPGLSSALHVHVGVSHLDGQTLDEILWQFVRWEPVLQRIAGGRWLNQRPNMNRTVRQELNWHWNDYSGGRELNTTNIIAVEDEYDSIADYGFYRAARRVLEEADRHSNLNIGQRRARTWEFRLWNATRAAWRMELFTGLSVALVDPVMVRNLAEVTPPRRMAVNTTGIQTIIDALSAADHDRTAELLMRQFYYLENQVNDAPTALTIV